MARAVLVAAVAVALLAGALGFREWRSTTDEAAPTVVRVTVSSTAGVADAALSEPANSVPSRFAKLDDDGVARAIETPSGIVVPVLRTVAEGWVVRTPCGSEVLIDGGRPISRVHVVLDPGHGGHEPGSVGSQGLTESEVNLDVALQVAELLEAEGVMVAMTRIDEQYTELNTRGRIANNLGPTVFLSVHHNGGDVSSNGDPGSMSVFQLDDPVSEDLAVRLDSGMQELLATVGAEQAEIAALDDLAVLEHRAGVWARRIESETTSLRLIADAFGVAPGESTEGSTPSPSITAPALIDPLPPVTAHSQIDPAERSALWWVESINLHGEALNELVETSADLVDEEGGSAEARARVQRIQAEVERANAGIEHAAAIIETVVDAATEARQRLPAPVVTAPEPVEVIGPDGSVARVVPPTIATTTTTLAPPEVVEVEVPDELEPRLRIEWVGGGDGGPRSFRGRRGDRLWLLRNTPGLTTVLTENLFITNDSEEALLAQPGFRTQQAEVIAATLIEYLERDDLPTVKPATDQVYDAASGSRRCVSPDLGTPTLPPPTTLPPTTMPASTSVPSSTAGPGVAGVTEFPTPIAPAPTEQVAVPAPTFAPTLAPVVTPAPAPAPTPAPVVTAPPTTSAASLATAPAETAGSESVAPAVTEAPNEVPAAG